MSRTVTLPWRCLASHCRICGGTKPIRPMRIGWVDAGAVGQFAVEDDVGRHEGFVVEGRGALLGHHVGADDRVAGAGERLHQEVEPVVELVVAERRAVEVQRVHRGDDGMHVAVLHAALVGDVVAHRVALQEVAVVEQDRVRGLGADRVDMGGGAGEADGVDRLVGVVVVGEDVDVQVGGLHDPQMRLAGLGAGRERVEDDERRAGGGEEGAAAHAERAGIGHRGLRGCCRVNGVISSISAAGASCRKTGVPRGSR